ncbi:MAG: hypothetical protein R3F56_03300 [Planctomycetota bacterium]
MSHRLLSLSLATLAWSVPAQSPSREVGLGVFPFLVGNMDAQISTVVNDAYAHGVDIIYCSAFRTTGPRTGQLWITDVAGTWNSTWGAVRSGGAGIDLRGLVQAAHARGIQVVAVLKCFESNAPPSDAAHKAYLLDIVRYLVHSYDPQGNPYYDVDGLALDYVRWVGGGGSVDPTQVTNFCRDVKAICGALSLHAYVLAGRYDFDGPTYDAVFNSYSSVINTLANGYGQHWEQMARYVDVMMPMAYTADGSIYNTAARHQAYVAKTAEYARRACTVAGFPQRRVAPAIKTYSDTETTTATTVLASAVGALVGGGDGYQAFRWGTLNGHNDWWQSLQQWAVPGPNRPIPRLDASLLSLTARLDPGPSTDPDGPAGSLDVRFDLDNDGAFDSIWLPQTQAYDWLLHQPGVGGRVGIEVRDLDGLVGSTHRAVQIGSVLALSSPTATYSAGTGGPLHLDIDVGPGGAGLTYAVLGGISGSVPGLPLAPGLTVPVNYDGVSAALLSIMNTPLFVNAFAALDGAGRGRATLNLPSGVLSPLAFRILQWGAFGIDARPRFVANPWSTAILP